VIKVEDDRITGSDAAQEITRGNPAHTRVCGSTITSSLLRQQPLLVVKGVNGS
jgi:hypothetical protein